MKGRKPIPTKLKVLTGNPGKQKLNEGVPQPDPGVPEMPPCLDEYARAEWEDKAPGLAALGVLTPLDSATLTAYCMSWSLFLHACDAISRLVDAAGGEHEAGMVEQTKNGNTIQNVLIGIRNKAAADCVKYAGELCMTPVGRERVSVGASKGKGKFDGLIGKGRKSG